MKEEEKIYQLFINKREVEKEGERNEERNREKNETRRKVCGKNR